VEDTTSPARAQFSSASYFDSGKAFAAAQREEVSLAAFDDLVEWLKGDGAQIALFDASNVTVQRRAKLHEKASKAKLGLVFLETICTDEAVIEEQMQWKVAHSPDFSSMETEAAMIDLRERIAHYEKVYQMVREAEGPYIKLFDLRAKAQCCNIYGRMANTVLPFLMALHAIDRPVFLFSLPAGDEADASLPHREALCKWAAAYARKAEIKIVASTEPRAIATAEALANAAGCSRPAHRPMLAPLLVSAGEEAAGATTVAPTFSTRFGESVSDLVIRLEPMVLEMEGATEPLFIIAQEAPIRTLRAYLLQARPAEITQRESIDPSFKASFGEQAHLVEFTSRDAGGFAETVHPLSSSG